MTHKEYLEARAKVDANNLASEQYRINHKTNGIPSEVCATFPFAEVVTNEMRSAIEVHEFMQDKPQKYFLYISEERAEAITWMGECLGKVIFGREYRDNFGGTRVPIDVVAINGVKYHGTYYKSSGNYARITAYKTPNVDKVLKAMKAN